jgi:hypothetical protein
VKTILICLLVLLSCSPVEKKEIKTEKIVKFQIEKFDIPKKNRGLLAEHYPASNERRIDLFWSVIKDLRGVYLGVGTDQNLSLAARAKSELVILMDFDPEIVKVNRLHVFFLKNTNNYSEFKNLWERKNKDSTIQFISNNAGNEKEDLLIGHTIGLKPGIGVPERLSELEYMHSNFKLDTFSHNSNEFLYLKNLALNEKIVPVNGDLTGDVSINEISKILSANGMTINLMYTSNAEEYFRFPKEYRQNIKAIPISENSIIVRTLTAGAKSYGFPLGEKFPDTFPFHYNYQPLSNLKKWMESPKEFNILYMMNYRTDIEKGFSKLEKEPPIN